MLNLKFDLKQIDQLSEDFNNSKKALKIIIPRVLRDHLRPLKRGLSSQIPRKTGAVRKSFGYFVKKKGDAIVAVFGFLRGKKISQETAIAANVLQHGSHVTPKTGKYLWIPLPTNIMRGNQPIVTPRELIDAGGFIQKSKLGNLLAFSKTEIGVIPLFLLKTSLTVAPRLVPFDARVESEIPAINKDIEETTTQVIEAGKAARARF